MRPGNDRAAFFVPAAKRDPRPVLIRVSKLKDQTEL
jgi:hypothetical protein